MLPPQQAPAAVAVVHRQALITARSLGLNHHDAQDVAQDVVLRALMTPRDLSTHTNHEAWAVVVATNVVHSEHRRLATRATSPLADIDDAPAPGPGVEDLAQARLDVERALRALAAVNPRYALAVFGKDVQDRPLAELAAERNVTESTFRQLLHRSRAAVRQEYARTN